MRNLTVFSAVLFAIACEGAAGPAGEEGADGAAGLDGAPGSAGAAGLDGSDGADAAVDPLLSPLDKALVAIGGQAALESLGGFELSLSGTRGIAFEGFTPDVVYPTVTVFDTIVSADLAGDRWRLDVERDNYLFGSPVAQTYSEIVDGAEGVVDGVESVFGFPTTMLSDRAASIRSQQRLLNPHLILRDLAADPSSATDGGVQLLEGSVHHLLVVAGEGADVTLWISATTGRLAKATTWENDPALSDVAVEVFYVGWAPTDGEVWFPTQVWLAVDGQVIHSESRTASVNPTFPVDRFDLPSAPVPYDALLGERGTLNAQFNQAFAGIGIPLDGLQDTPTPTEIAPGVWHLTTASHHAMLVEQSAGLVLFDAPLNPELADGILEWAATEFPGKSVTHVVSSHFHRDHVGGLRSLVAAGATVVAHGASRAFYDDVFSRPRTLQPDALALDPVAPTYWTVPDGGSVTLDDPLRPVLVVSIANTHAADFVVPYLPNEQVAFSVDLYSPAFGVTPQSLELYQGLATQHGLTVGTVAGGHGYGTTTWAAFEAELVAAGLL